MPLLCCADVGCSGAELLPYCANVGVTKLCNCTSVPVWGEAEMSIALQYLCVVWWTCAVALPCLCGV